MPGYIKKALQRFKHQGIKNVEDAPASYNKPYLGAKQQWADNASTEGILAPSDIKHVQSVVGTLLYCAIAVDNTMLVALENLSSEQKQLQIQHWRHWHSFWIIPICALMHKCVTTPVT